MKFMICLFLFAVSTAVWSQAISITQRSDMSFGTVVAGSGPYVVAPGTGESNQNASFRVEGARNTAFTIILPTTATVSLNGAGVFNITVSNFTSFPVGTGFLPNNRRADIYVGARIASVPITTPGGSYRGNFSVEVVY